GRLSRTGRLRAVCEDERQRRARQGRCHHGRRRRAGEEVTVMTVASAMELAADRRPAGSATPPGNLEKMMSRERLPRPWQGVPPGQRTAFDRGPALRVTIRL